MFPVLQESLNMSVRKLIAGYAGYAQQVAMVNHWLSVVSTGSRRLSCSFACAARFLRNGVPTSAPVPFFPSYTLNQSQCNAISIWSVRALAFRVQPTIANI